jgi:hypothetical protein
MTLNAGLRYDVESAGTSYPRTLNTRWRHLGPWRRREVAIRGGAPGYQTITVAPNSEVRITGEFGVLKLTLLADSYQWEFIPVSGRGDTGTGSCH